MKQVKTLLIAAVLLFGASQTSNAQAKVAHVDIQEIMSKMPAMIEAQKQMQQVGKTYEETFNTMTTEYKTKIDLYGKEETTAGAKLNEERGKEIQDMQKRISDYRETAQKELEAKNAELQKPIIEKIKASIQKVAKIKGFQYVLNIEGLIVAEGPNVTEDVKKDLGFSGGAAIPTATGTKK
jgi:outer membrane protein